MKRVLYAAAATLLISTALSPTVLAQTAPSGGDELPRIRITDPNRDLFRLALPNVVGDGGLVQEAQDIQRRGLEIMGLFNLLNPTSFPADLQREGMGFSSALWSQVGAQGVVKLRVAREGGGTLIEGRLYQVGRGEASLLSRTYKGPALRPLLHTWINDVIELFTGVRGVFGSRIAFASSGRQSEIGSVGADGSEVKVLTNMGAECLMPAVSPDGTRLAFTSYLRGTPDLWIVPAGGGRARTLSRRAGMNSGATWTRDGREVVLTMSFEGNAELYRISSQDGRVLNRLTRSPFIDMSATLSPDGSQIAFVSDRGGNPQIYLMAATGGDARRLTFQGGNNTTPRWSPRADKPQIAFTGRDERGVFDVFVYDLKSKNIERVTEGQGSNQSADWSPDGRLLVYASSRGGLFVMNPVTRRESQIYRGRVNSPSWGPAPKP
jgi:TolB protein